MLKQNTPIKLFAEFENKSNFPWSQTSVFVKTKYKY